MNTYIKYLREYLTDKHPNYGYSDANSLLDMLFYAYTLDNPIYNETIKARFEELDHILSRLTLDDNNSVFMLTADLCAEHAKLAFLSGVHTGARLFIELSDNEHQ